MENNSDDWVKTNVQEFIDELRELASERKEDWFREQYLTRFPNELHKGCKTVSGDVDRFLLPLDAVYLERRVSKHY